MYSTFFGHPQLPAMGLPSFSGIETESLAWLAATSLALTVG